MKRYTVIWDPDLESEFVRVWIAGDSALRAALTYASNWIDQNLSLDPEKQGRPSAVDPKWRTLLIPDTGAYSIAVLYRVIPEDQHVEVLAFQYPSSM